MPKGIRQENLLKLLMENDGISISDLAERLHVSPMTVRRDLSTLEEKGYVKTMHGGAVLRNVMPNKGLGEKNFYTRYSEYNEEKKRIGKFAASLVKPNSVVFFDPSTTVNITIQNIQKNYAFTAITTSIMNALTLSEFPNVNTVMIGGELHNQTLSTINQSALNTISEFHADIAFFSTESILIPDGTYEMHMSLIDVKKAVRDSSDQSILLIDHSKIGMKSLRLSFSLDMFDMIITDSNIDEECYLALQQINQNVIKA